MKLVYPACFYASEVTNGAYTVIVPDLPGCVSEGNNLAEAIEMGIDAASGWVLGELEDGNFVPIPSRLEDVIPDDGGFVSMLLLDMHSYAEKYGKTAVRKNLTIPAWLNTFAESANINFSKVLQNALETIYHKQYE